MANQRMFRIVAMAFLIAALSAVWTSSYANGLEVGMQAPDFKLPSTDGKPITLSDYTGKSNVLLSFYVFDFSPT